MSCSASACAACGRRYYADSPTSDLPLLCRGCYDLADVRRRFRGRLTPRQDPTQRPGWRSDFYGRGGDPEPTGALPGTPEKVAVLSARASLGLSLFHPLDAREDDGGTRPCSAAAPAASGEP